MKNSPRRIVVLALVCLCVVGTDVRAGIHADDGLINQKGEPVPWQELSDHWLLVYFGYTACPDRCPASLSTMAVVLRQLGTRGEALLPIFVSLDPARDTLPVLAANASHFSPRLLALTGSEAALADAARSFGVAWKARSSGVGLDHGLFVCLVAPGGEVVDTFHPNVPLRKSPKGSLRACGAHPAMDRSVVVVRTAGW